MSGVTLSQKWLEGSIAKVVKTRIRILAALVIREMTARFGSKVGGYAWALAEPAIIITMLSAIFSAIGRRPPLGESFPIFYASGFVAMQFYTTMVGQINNAIKGNRQLLSYPIIAPIDFIIARVVVQFSTTTLVVFLVLGGLIWYQDLLFYSNYLLMIAAAVLGSLIAVGVGLFNIVMFRLAPLYEQVFTIITRPMFLISGVIFLPESLPPHFRELMLWNPVAHVILLFRKGLYGYYRAPFLDLRYLLEFTAIALLIGLVVFTLSRRIREKE